MTKARLAGLVFGILLIIAAFGIVLWQGMNMPATGVAFAQGGTTPTPSATTTTTPPQTQQASIGDTFWGILAGKLNVSVDTLKAQAVAARQQMIDQAVTDGRITQAQADAIKSRITSDNIIAPIRLPGVAGQPNLPNGLGPFGGRRFGFGNRLPGGGLGFGTFGFNLQDLDAVAKALNMDSKTLLQQLAQGKTLADIAQAQNIDQSVVKQAIINARTAEIDQLLSLGLISQVQADALKARLTPDNIDLTRPLFFRNRVPGGTSQVEPNFGSSQPFGGPSNGGLAIPPADIQTQ